MSGRPIKRTLRGLSDLVAKRQTPDKNGPVPGSPSRLLARRTPLKMDVATASRNLITARSVVMVALPPPPDHHALPLTDGESELGMGCSCSALLPKTRPHKRGTNRDHTSTGADRSVAGL